jgi:hypothetical protein
MATRRPSGACSPRLATNLARGRRPDRPQIERAHCQPRIAHRIDTALGRRMVPPAAAWFRGHKQSADTRGSGTAARTRMSWGKFGPGLAQTRHTSRGSVRAGCGWSPRDGRGADRRALLGRDGERRSDAGQRRSDAGRSGKRQELPGAVSSIGHLRHAAVGFAREWRAGGRSDTTQHSTAQHSTAQHSTAQHSTAQHSTAQHSTAQHSTAQHRASEATPIPAIPWMRWQRIRKHATF